VLRHIIFITACAQNVLLQHELKRWTLTLLTNSTFNNHVTQSGSLAIDASFYFSSLTYDLKINKINVKQVV